MRTTSEAGPARATTFIAEIYKLLEAGCGFVPLIGTGVSAPAGVPVLVQIRDYLKRRFKAAAIEKIHIERKVDKLTVTLHSGRPGVIIGRKGSEIDNVTRELEQRSGAKVKVNIIEVRKPQISGQLVAENVADQDRKILFEDLPVHDDSVSHGVGPQVHQVFPVFGVVIDDLTGGQEVVVDLVAEDGPPLLPGVLPVKAHGADELDVFLPHPGGQALLYQQRDGGFAMGSPLEPAFHPVGETDGDPAALPHQLGDGGHADGVLNRCFGGRLRVIQCRWVRHRFPGYEYFGGIRECGFHRTFTVLEGQSLHAVVPSVSLMRLFLSCLPDSAG